jgi:hypothetical protein
VHKIEGQSHRPGASAETGAALLSHLEEIGLRVVAPSGTGQEGVLLPRGKGRAPKGKLNGTYRHGRFTAKVIAKRRALAISTRATVVLASRFSAATK